MPVHRHPGELFEIGQRFLVIVDAQEFVDSAEPAVDWLGHHLRDFLVLLDLAVVVQLLLRPRVPGDQ